MDDTTSVPLSELVQAISPKRRANTTETQAIRITGVTSDSRQVQEGTLFVAVKGDAVDGHAYVPHAVNAGAVAVVGTLLPTEMSDAGIALPEDVPYVVVEDARLALAQAAAAFYGNPSREMTVIGVTGTDGKTTTCSLIESILVESTRSDAYPNGRVGVITTVGARILGEELETGFHVTTPDAPDVQRYLAQMRDAGCLYAVVESTSHGLAQRRVAAVEYDVAAVTNITHEHLDYHGTREAYVQAKALLFRSLYQRPTIDGQPRFAVLNRDDDGSYGALQQILQEEAERYPRDVSTLTYSAEQWCQEIADVIPYDIACSPTKTTFDIRWTNRRISIETSLIGQFNVQNILCAASVTLGLGIKPVFVRQGIQRLPGVIGRMERIDCGQPFLAIVDFAHSPGSLERALQTLRPLVSSREDGHPGHLIAVFGCAGLRDRQKRKLMGEVSGRLADYTVVTAEDPRTEDLGTINREIESGLLEHVTSDRYSIVPDRTDAIVHAVRIAKAGDVVVAFGKGHERSMCFGTSEFPWSDQNTMENALKAWQSAVE